MRNCDLQLPEIAQPQTTAERTAERLAFAWALCSGSGPARHRLLVDVTLEHAPLDERLFAFRSIGRVRPYT